ncbi:hypothetical protein O3P69_014995, partial [Scylla paramamosain]
MDQAAFELQLRQTLQGKAENAVIQPALQRDQWLQDLLRINSSGAQSTFDYNLKKRYEVLQTEAEAETGAEAEAATGAEAEEEAQTGAETEAEAETRAGRSEAEAET